MSRGLILFALLAAVTTTACRRTTHHETGVQVTRVATVRRDDAGKPVTVDVEVAFHQCPGTQTEVVRGGPELASCIAKYKIGDEVKAEIDHEWSPAGYYTWKIRRLGECERKVDPDDEASYAMVRECEDWVVNGQKAGFSCRYVPEKKLIDACPWFRRR